MAGDFLADFGLPARKSCRKCFIELSVRMLQMSPMKCA